MLSERSSGLPKSDNGDAQLLAIISSGGLFVLLCCVALLAFFPSWYLAIGVVAVAMVLGYMFHVASQKFPRA